MTVRLMVSTLFLTGSAVGCSSAQIPKQGSEMARNAPSVMGARTNPPVFELNKDMLPSQLALVTADIKDFEGNINDVRLRFTHVPIEIPMSKMSGTTWRAEISPDQLRQLAVNGQTMKYDATVIATNDKGETSQSNEPIQITVIAPAAGSS